DVGGLRSERKKWIHCFENGQHLCYWCPSSSTTRCCMKIRAKNRMEEALTLFDSICNSRWFIKTRIILFLNKIDLFAEKLPYSPVGDYLPDY
ncbi:G-alpha-domain-containing protein, partial [Ramaria rubella]